MSVAVQVTVVVPMEKTEPDGGEQLTGTNPSTTSMAVGSAKLTAVFVAPAVTSTLIGGAFASAGAVVS
jgi:hypothetical protein